MTDVFITAKRRFRAEVEQLAAALRALKLSVAYDAGPEPTASFSGEGDPALQEASAVLVGWSADCFPRGGDVHGWVRGQAGLALRRRVIVPVLLEAAGIDPPFDALNTESLIGFVRPDGLGRQDAPAWLSVVAAIGQLTGRPGLSSYVRARTLGQVDELRRWAQIYPGDPLAPDAQAFAVVHAAPQPAPTANETPSGAPKPRITLPAWALPAFAGGAALGAVLLAFVVLRPTPDAPAAPPPPPLAQAAATALTPAAPVDPYVDARRTPATTPAPLIQGDPAALADFALFRECATCPDMVIVPLGTFLMGSPSWETDRQDDEDVVEGYDGAQISVSLRRFAVARFETSVAEYHEFAAAAARPSVGECFTRQGGQWGLWPERSYLATGLEQEGGHPAVCVTWEDAAAFAEWTQGRVEQGADYRLIAEAEFEYVSRAGAATAFPWGDDPAAACAHANGGDEALLSEYQEAYGLTIQCYDAAAHAAPRGSYQANAFGVFDMIGNVMEWTSDCYRSSYAGQAQNGAPFEQAGCAQRVARGGAYDAMGPNLRAADRQYYAPSTRDARIGFRLARTL